MPVGERHREFRFDVAQRANAANHYPGTCLPDEIDRQAVKRPDLNVVELAGRRANLLNPFVDRKQRLLVEIDADPHDQLIDQAATPLDHVQVTQRDRVKRARIDGDSQIGLAHNRFNLFGIPQRRNQSFDFVLGVVSVWADSQTTAPETSEDILRNELRTNGLHVTGPGKGDDPTAMLALS